jgi:N-acetylmuramoyl-L-alanine amidase
MLVLSMLTWTGLTAAVGWYMLRGSPAPVAVAADDVVFDVAGPNAPHQVHHLTPEQASATLPSLAPQPTPTRATGGPRPAPAYALPVGPSANVQPVDPNHVAAPPAIAHPVSKGVVVLDPGHGRGDPGATHYLPDGSRRWDITEADSNMLNAELIKADLVAMGYEVYLTREDGEAGPGGPLPLQFITSDLYRRVALARSVDADVFLAIHGNGATVHSISGPETWYCGKHQEGAANEQFATMIQRAMMDALHEYGYFPPDRGIKEDAETHHSGDFCQFVVTRETPVPAALLEFLFLTNDDDAHVLVDPKAHEIMAQHVANAIDAFLTSRAGH